MYTPLWRMGEAVNPISLKVSTNEYEEVVEKDASGATLYHADGTTPQKRRIYKYCSGFVRYINGSSKPNLVNTSSTGKENECGASTSGNSYCSYIIDIDTHSGIHGKKVSAEMLLSAK